MKPAVTIAVIGAVATVVAASLAILPKFQKAANTAPQPQQQTQGPQSPNVSSKGDVTISYGEKGEFKRAIEPPIFGNINVEIPYGYFVSATDKSGIRQTVYGQPISRVEGVPNEHSQDVILEFDVTNPNAMELRLTKLEIEVTQFFEGSNMSSDPVASAGDTRRYFCNLQSKPGLYACKPLSADFDFIKVAKGELEHFGVNVNTRTRGIYQLAVWVEYAVGTEKQRTKVGDVPRRVGFF